MTFYPLAFRAPDHEPAHASRTWDVLLLAEDRRRARRNRSGRLPRPTDRDARPPTPECDRATMIPTPTLAWLSSIIRAL